jgi:hypothetical protein
MRVFPGRGGMTERKWTKKQSVILSEARRGEAKNFASLNASIRAQSKDLALFPEKDRNDFDSRFSKPLDRPFTTGNSHLVRACVQAT